MVDPREPDAPPIWGYATKESAVGLNLQHALQKSIGQSIPLIVTLKYPDNPATDDQVWVDEFVADGWVAFGN
jgi:hypothetical protein